VEKTSRHVRETSKTGHEDEIRTKSKIKYMAEVADEEHDQI
jgi:hypothetical protein